MGSTHIDFTWTAGTGFVTGYRVSGRCGGEGPCVVLIEDTGDSECRASAPVSSGSWWELRVAAISDGVVGAESKLTQPVMTKSSHSTKSAPARLQVRDAHEHRGRSGRERSGRERDSKKSGRHGSRRQRSSHAPAPAEEAALSDEGEAGPPSAADRLETEYAAAKAAVQAWEQEFAAKNGRPPNERERAASPRYRRTAAMYARLRGERQKLQVRWLPPHHLSSTTASTTCPPSVSPLRVAPPCHPCPIGAAGGEALEPVVARGARVQRRQDLGRKWPLPCWTTPPHLPAWRLLEPRPLLRTPESRLSILEAWRGFRSPKMRTFPSSPPAGVTLAERVWELEARIQQWEFEFFRDKGRKPAFIERREDAEHMRMEVRGRHATAAAARLSLPLPLPPPSLPARRAPSARLSRP